MPGATRAIFGLCVLLQFVRWLAGPVIDEVITQRFAVVPLRLTMALYAKLPVLSAFGTLVTHMWWHFGWLHLVLNMVFLAWVGTFVEQRIGAARLLALFTACGIAGGLLQWAVTPLGTVPGMGASGAISGVFAAYAVYFAKASPPRRILGLAVPGALFNALWFAAAWIGLQLLTGLAFNTGPVQIGIWPHIGGFLAGLIMARRLARR